MLRSRHFVTPIAALAVTLVLVAAWPGLTWLWVVLFAFTSAFLVMLGLIGTFLRLNRYLEHGEIEKLQGICEPIWLRNKQRRVGQLAGLYLAESHLVAGEEEGARIADALLNDIEVRKLGSRFINRYWMARARTALYQGDVALALTLLKNSTLQAINKTHLSRLLYLFSLLFVAAEQELPRSLQYAKKARELKPVDSLIKAQWALCRHRLEEDPMGLSTLREALHELDPRRHLWERRYFESYLRHNDHLH